MLTNIEVKALTLLSSAAAKYNSQDMWKQRRFELASQLYIHNDSLTEAGAIESADRFIEEYRKGGHR